MRPGFTGRFFSSRSVGYRLLEWRGSISNRSANPFAESENILSAFLPSRASTRRMAALATAVFPTRDE